jgi:hypothetical protein
MIQFTKSYKTTDGQVFGSIESAQEHEIFVALSLSTNPSGPTIAKMILDKKDVLVDILTTTASSKPKARSINGGKKKRTTVATVVAPTVITAAASSVGSTNNA